MPDERRKARRARIPGMRVTIEGADGERVEAEVLDVGSGGLFIRTTNPLAVGKRLSLEIQNGAGGPTWSALGRVVWNRATGTKDAAPGMGVKLIDVEDAVVAAIARVVETSSSAPVRERTVLGIRAGTTAPAPPVP